MIKRLKTIVLLILLFFLMAAVSMFWLYDSYTRFLSRPLYLTREQSFEIAPGSSASKVVDKLYDEGFIQNRYFMRYAFDQSGLSKRLMPGSFVIMPGMTADDLAELFAGMGKYAMQSFQVQAGNNLYELAEQFSRSGLLEREAFLAAAFDTRLLKEHALESKSFEGYLAAGSYRILRDASAENMISLMHQRWLEDWEALKHEHQTAYAAYLEASWSVQDIVTLASMIEKEAVVPKEKPVIARVFLNRLTRKMRLQSDPSCVYPPQTLGEKPSPSRCKDKNNRYSTYVIAGLPPTPITLPSEASLRAVLAPYTGPNALELLFFVARQDGTWTHYFSTTYAEHKQAIAYYLQKKKGRKPSATVQP